MERHEDKKEEKDEEELKKGEDEDEEEEERGEGRREVSEEEKLEDQEKKEEPMFRSPLAGGIQEQGACSIAAKQKEGEAITYCRSIEVVPRLVVA